jgi:hypothetical protein
MKYLKLYEFFRNETDDKIDELNEEWQKISNRLYKESISVKANIGLKDYTDISLFLMDIKSLKDIPGLGTKGMNELISFADKHNLPTWLLASSNYGSDLDRLVKFYERFGFVYVGEYGNIGKEMYRKNNI